MRYVEERERSFLFQESIIILRKKEYRDVYVVEMSYSVRTINSIQALDGLVSLNQSNLKMSRGTISGSEITQSVLHIFKDAHTLKLKGLYVDIQHNNVIVPEDAINSAKYKEVLDFLNMFAYGFDIILGANDEQF